MVLLDAIGSIVAGVAVLLVLEVFLTVVVCVVGARLAITIVGAAMLGKVIGAREGLVAVGAHVGTFLGVCSYMPYA